MKKVSFKVAKALKDAGYPQKDYGHHYSKTGTQLYGAIWDSDIYIPSYLDVWLWLWKEKKYSINIDCHIGGKWSTDMSMEDYPDQEEALIAAINYLIDKDLI